MTAPALSTEGHVLARNRTWASTFAESCARPSHPEDVENKPVAEPPTRESNPALRLRRPPCIRHTRGESGRVPSPGVEPGLRPSESRVPSVTRQGHERSRRPGSNRHGPAYKAGASPFGHVGGQRGARSRTLSASFGGSLLSQEHTPVNGPACPIGGIVIPPPGSRSGCPAGVGPVASSSTGSRAAVTPRTPSKGRRIHRLAPQRKGRESNPQGSALARFPSGSRRPSGSPSIHSTPVGDAGIEPAASPV